MAADLHVAVVGAGIGGLSAALSLHEVGARVDVFDAVPELRPLGVGINLLPHAVLELDAMGLLDRLRPHAIEPSRLVYCTKRGQEIWSEPRGFEAGYRWPQLSVHRGRLQEALHGSLVDRLGAGRIHLGHRLVGVEADGRRPVAVFAHGRFEADVLIGADGIHSIARAARYPSEGPPIWNGSLLWRGVAAVPPVLDGRTMVWAGHPDQKFVGYPIADLDGGLQAFNFIAELRRPDSPLAVRGDWNRQGRLEDFLPEFEDWRFGWLDVPAVIRSAPETFLFPMVDRDPLPQWGFGRTTLLGDAAHPMYPIGSNGASQAILDARALAGCLRGVVDGRGGVGRGGGGVGRGGGGVGRGDRGGGVEAALARYEGLRRAATAAIVAANRRLGPELPMKLVEERAPDGFDRISDVISREEILEVTEEYRRTAGFALAALAEGRSLIEQAP